MLKLLSQLSRVLLTLSFFIVLVMPFSVSAQSNENSSDLGQDKNSEQNVNEVCQTCAIRKSISDQMAASNTDSDFSSNSSDRESNSTQY